MAEWLVSDSCCVPGLHTKTGKDLWAIPGNHPVLHKDHVSSDRWISGKFRRKNPKLWKCLHLANPLQKHLRGDTLLLVFFDKTFLPVRVEGAGSNVDAQLLPPKQNTKTCPGLGPLSPRCHVVFPRHEKNQKRKQIDASIRSTSQVGSFFSLGWDHGGRNAAECF